MKHQTIYILSIAFFILACDADNKPIFDEEAPHITILSPEDGATYEPGASLELRATIQENLELHEYSAVLRGKDGEVALTIDAGHTHEKELTIERTFKLPNLENASFTLTIKANDHEDNLETSTIAIYTH